MAVHAERDVDYGEHSPNTGVYKKLYSHYGYQCSSFLRKVETYL